MEIVNNKMSEEELIAAVRDALTKNEEDDGYMTTREIATALKCKEELVRLVLRRLWEAGQLENRRVVRQTFSGSYMPIGYRIKKGKEVEDGTTK